MEIRILFLLSARDWGGNEKWTWMAAHTLAKLPGYTVHIAYRDEIVGQRFTIPKLKLPFRSEFDIQTYYTLYKYIKNNQIDILIPTKRKDYFIAGILAKLLKKKNILRLGIVRPMRGLYHRFLYAYLADGIIVNAKRIKNTLLQKKWFDPERIRVVYNGFDSSTVDANSNLSIDKPYPLMICSVGRVTSRKGFDLLIRGFAEYQRKYNSKDTGLWIIGDGEDLDDCKALATKLGIAAQVCFTGFQSNPYPYLYASDIFALLSKNEGISNALLEGIYTDNAVITTRAGGAEELITHGKEGYFVDHGNINQVAEALRKLINNPELRQKMKAAAKDKMQTMFSIPQMQADLIDFISHIKAL